MKRLYYCTLLIVSIITSTAYAQKGGDGYPYDRSVTGCVDGNCTNGFGVYVWDNDSYYAGEWSDGKQNGEGRYVLVNGGPWSNAYVLVGRWIDGSIHGRSTLIYPSGTRKEMLWYRDEDVTAQVENCRTASTASNAYKGFVAIINGLAAAARGDDVLEGAAWGYDAAGEQTVPKVVDLTCEQLLREFE